MCEEDEKLNMISARKKEFEKMTTLSPAKTLSARGETDYEPSLKHFRRRNIFANYDAPLMIVEEHKNADEMDDSKATSLLHTDPDSQLGSTLKGIQNNMNTK